MQNLQKQQNLSTIIPHWIILSLFGVLFSMTIYPMNECLGIARLNHSRFHQFHSLLQHTQIQEMRTIRLYLHPLIQPVAIYFVCPPINLILQASKSKIYLYEKMQDYLKPYDRTFAVKLHLDAINQAIRSCFHPPSNTSRIFLLHPSLRIVLHPKSCPGGFYWFRSTSLLRDKHESMLPLGNLIG